MQDRIEHLKVGDAVEWYGKRYIAVLFMQGNWHFQVAKKDGTANRRTALQILHDYDYKRIPKD